MTKQKIIIGLCTANRPKMLAECVASLKKQEFPENIELSLLVVENTEQPNAKAFIKTQQDDFPYELVYAHEPKRGIPIARNRVLDKALEKNADWIAFIDDDEIAEPDWIASLSADAEKYQADVVHGEVHFIYPEPKPFWTIEKKKLGKVSGDLQKTAATNNTLFSKKLFKDWEMRFDENLKLTGGEDTDYFNRAYEKGAKIISSDTTVKETVPIERCTYISYCKMAIRMMATAITLKRKKKWSTLKIALHYLPKSIRRIIRGIIYIILTPFSILLGKEMFKKTALKAGNNICSSASYFASICNFNFNYYKKTHGE